MPGGGGLGRGMGGLGVMPGLWRLVRLSGLVNDARSGESERSALAAREGSGLSLPALWGLTSRSGPREVAAAIIKGAQRRGYSRSQTIAILSTARQESGLNPRAVGGGGAWHSIFQQDSSYRGRDDPNQNIAGFFNRLAAREGWRRGIFGNQSSFFSRRRGRHRPSRRTLMAGHQAVGDQKPARASNAVIRRTGVGTSSVGSHSRWHKSHLRGSSLSTAYPGFRA